MPSFLHEGLIALVREKPDDRKLFTWPLYAVSARARYECPFVLVVATPSKATARWAANPIDLGVGQLWSPLVVGPEGIPMVIDADRAQRDPELAVLSVIAHGKGDAETAVSIAVAATSSLGQLSEEQRVLYLALIESALGDAARKAFEMHPQTEKLMSSWQRGSFEKGTAEGLLRGKAEAVLEVLEGRGLTVSAFHHKRILGCSDPEVLKTWLRHAGTVASTDVLLGE